MFPAKTLPHVSHYYTDAHPYYRQRVVVVGGKNSAAEASLELFRGGAHVTLVHRHAALGDSIKYWVRPDIENRIKEGSIGARFESSVVAITPTAVVIDTKGTQEELPAEGVFLLTGYHPDVDLMTPSGNRVPPRHTRADAESRDVRDQRAQSVHRRWGSRRPADGKHLHRERSLSWRTDRQRARREAPSGLMSCPLGCASSPVRCWLGA